MLNNKNYLQITAWLFVATGAVHAARLVYVWPAQIGDVVVPMWASWVAVFVAGFLALHAFLLGARG